MRAKVKIVFSSFSTNIFTFHPIRFLKGKMILIFFSDHFLLDRLELSMNSPGKRHIFFGQNQKQAHIFKIISENSILQYSIGPKFSMQVLSFYSIIPLFSVHPIKIFVGEFGPKAK